VSALKDLKQGDNCRGESIQERRVWAAGRSQRRVDGAVRHQTSQLLLKMEESGASILVEQFELGQLLVVLRRLLAVVMSP